MGIGDSHRLKLILSYCFANFWLFQIFEHNYFPICTLSPPQKVFYLLGVVCAVSCPGEMIFVLEGDFSTMNVFFHQIKIQTPDLVSSSSAMWKPLSIPHVIGPYKGTQKKSKGIRLTQNLLFCIIYMERFLVRMNVFSKVSFFFPGKYKKPVFGVL